MGLYFQSEVEIGRCDNCYNCIFADDNYYVIKKKVICADCLEEMDDNDCSNKRD